jgi:hypothetical protein
MRIGDGKLLIAACSSYPMKAATRIAAATGAATAELGRRGHGMGADADQPDGARSVMGLGCGTLGQAINPSHGIVGAAITMLPTTTTWRARPRSRQTG